MITELKDKKTREKILKQKKLKKKTQNKVSKTNKIKKSKVKETKEFIEKVKPDTIQERKKYKEKLLKKFEEYNNNGKITIAYFCDTFYPIIDGVIGVLNNYANLISKKCNVVVFVPKHKGKTITKNYTVVGVNSAYFKFVNYDLAFPELDSDLQSVIKKLRIDLIHSHSPFNMGAFAIKLGKKRKVPVVFTLHSQYKKDFLKATKSEPIAKMLLKYIMRQFNKSTETWTMHKSALDTLLQYGYKGKYFLIENATNYKYPENDKELIEKVNEIYDIKDCPNVFLFVGRLVKQKNILFTVDALKVLKDKGIKFKMFFVGNGPDEKELKEKILELELENEIIVTGRIEDINTLIGLYLRADLFLFPSLYDMSSIVQLEAAAHKTPTLFIDGSVTACTVKNNENGFTCEDSLDAYVDRIIEIITDKENLKRVSENAHKTLYVEWEDVVDKAYERYLELIGENNKMLEEEALIKTLKKQKNN